MADNDKYIIIKENESIKLIGGNTKTRAEYEDMIAESIYNCSVDSLSITWYNVKNDISLHNTRFYKNILKESKAVVDRLFGDIR